MEGVSKTEQSRSAVIISRLILSDWIPFSFVRIRFTKRQKQPFIALKCVLYCWMSKRQISSLRYLKYYSQAFSSFVRLVQKRTSNPVSQRLVSEVIFDADEFRKKNISYGDDGRHYLLLTYPVWRLPTFFMLKTWHASLKLGFVPFVSLAHGHYQ